MEAGYSEDWSELFLAVWRVLQTLRRWDIEFFDQKNPFTNHDEFSGYNEGAPV